MPGLDENIVEINEPEPGTSAPISKKSQARRAAAARSAKCRPVAGSERALWAPAGRLYGARSSDHRFTHLRNDDRSDTQRQRIHAIQSVLRARRLFQVHGTSAV
ncbi:hypothetical protein ACJJTC_005007 [Scirpophaga incertulas]